MGQSLSVRWFAKFCGILGITGLAGSASAARLEIARLFAPPDLSGPTLRAPQFSPDGRYLAYLKGRPDNKDRLDLWAFDIRAHRHVRLVDSASLAPQPAVLAAEEAQRRERQRLSALSGIIEYRFSPDSRYLLVPLEGDLYLYDLQAAPGVAVRRLTNTPAYETDARFSPKGHFVSYVRGQNLYVYDLAAREERAITHGGGGPVSYGVAEFVAQEEMERYTGYWWAPDESRIAFTRVDESAVAEIERIEILASSARVTRQRYPAAGARNAEVQLLIAPLGGGAGGDAAVRADLGPDSDIYLARVDWFPDSRSLAVQRQSRDQKTLTLLALDAASGQARELLTERSETWVDLSDEFTFLPKSRQFVWASSRTGYRHLYLYDFEGRLLRPLTSGQWMVSNDLRERAIRGIDEAHGLLYFVANRDTPLERHLYAASLLDPALPLRRVTQERGWHGISMSRDATMYLDTFSTPEQPPSYTLRATSGASVAELEPNRLDASHPYFAYLAQHSPTQFGTLAAEDGQTLHYQIVKPRVLEPGRRYPVVIDVYGGPGVQNVRRAWGGAEEFFQQMLAQRGYVVFSLDNRGSGMRGVHFENVLYRQLGAVEVRDQVRGAEFLRTLPYVDPRRIGMFGWSYGGYLTLMCLMRSPSTFAAGIAGAPVTDWSLYDTHYAERYLGTPLQNAAGYAQSNVLTHAAGLSGPLLLLHGMADDNVLFANSTALMQRLQGLDKPFDLMTYPGAKHSLLRHADTGPHAYAQILRFLDAHLGSAAPASRD